MFKADHGALVSCDCDDSVMDWVALASVISSGVVAVATLVANGLMRRGDRKHTSSLEFEKRVWEKKSTALLDLISHSQAILHAIDRDADPEPRRQQFAVLQTFHQLSFRLEAPELIAYASPASKTAVSKLQQVMSRVQRTSNERKMVAENYALTPDHFGVDEDEFEHLPVVRAQEIELERRLGELSGIDLDSVRKLCIEIIDHSRTDLRGA
ncbi:MAG: hypothetical protein WBB07_09655 [Mycobacterium sp.]